MHNIKNLFWESSSSWEAKMESFDCNHKSWILNGKNEKLPPLELQHMWKSHRPRGCPQENTCGEIIYSDYMCSEVQRKPILSWSPVVPDTTMAFLELVKSWSKFIGPFFLICSRFKLVNVWVGIIWVMVQLDIDHICWTQFNPLPL